RLDVLAGWLDPGVDVEVESADLSVAWGIVRMVQLWPCGEVALELYPVEALHLPLGVSLREGVEFAICHAIEDPAICADIHWRVQKLNSCGGIACGDDRIFFDLALGTSGLSDCLGEASS